MEGLQKKGYINRAAIGRLGYTIRKKDISQIRGIRCSPETNSILDDRLVPWSINIVFVFLQADEKQRAKNKDDEMRADQQPASDHGSVGHRQARNADE